MSLFFRSVKKKDSAALIKRDNAPSTNTPKGLVYGVNVKDMEEPVPKIIDDILLYLEKHFLKLQGVFRVSGRATQMREIKERIETGITLHDITCDYEGDISALEIVGHNFTGLIKTWLRDMPDPLFTFALFDDFVNAAKIQDANERMTIIKTLIGKLPNANKIALARLCYTLRKVSEHEKVNKMSMDNLAIVFGSNILRPPAEVSALEVAQKTGFVNKCCRIILENSAELFKDQNNGKFRKRMSSRKPPKTPKKWSVRNPPLAPGEEAPSDKDFSHVKTEQVETIDDDLESWLHDDKDNFVNKEEPKPEEKKQDDLENILDGF